MNVSSHFRKRYCLRLLGISEADINSYIKENMEYVDEQCLSLFSSSEWIWKGTINGNGISNFYISGMIIVVTDEINNTLVTLWNADFGFSEKINKKITKDLVNDIKKLFKDEEKACQKISSEADKLELDIENVRSQIALLTKQIEKYENNVVSLEQQIASLKDKPLLIKAKIDSNATKLFSSLDYKMDMLRINKEVK